MGEQLITLPVILLLCLTSHLAAKKFSEPDGSCWNMHCNHIQNVTSKPKSCHRPTRDCVRRTTENGDKVECKPVGKNRPRPDLVCSSSFFRRCMCDTAEDNSAICVCTMPTGAKISIVLLGLFGMGVLVIFLAAFRWFLGKKHKIKEELRKQELSELSGEQRKISSLNEPRPLTVIPEGYGEDQGRKPGRVSNAVRPGRISVGVNGHQGRVPRVSACGPGAQPRPSRVSTGYAGAQPRRPRISTGGAGVQPRQPRISTGSVESQPRQPRISTGSVESQPRPLLGSTESEESKTRGHSVSTTDTVL